MTTVYPLALISRCTLGLLTTFMIVTVTPAAWGQTISAAEWRYGTTLAGFAGAASASSDTDGVGGLALGWEITPRFGVEGRGLWLRAGDSESAFAAVLAARVAMRPARPIVPFLSAGVGMYRATFDTGASAIPGFYRTRITSGGLGSQTFNDFALSFGGGTDVFLTRHLALRPEVSVLLATTRADVRTVTVYGAQLAYHFESHPIAP